MSDSASDAATSAASSRSEESPARTLGEFRLLRKLGQGGMAEVWLAEQTSLERRVALKLLRKEWMREEKYVARFQREASAAGSLNHPNIVQVHMVGEEGGQHYIAQEYVKGVTLKHYLRKKGPPHLPLALHIMRQVASALKAAGDAGIVHRDIKPENIMLTSKGDAKVADFGLAQLYGSGEGVDITQEGMTVGTPLYMSPEQVHGGKIDPRSDIYSFGVTCFHMLSGRPPFDGPTAMSIAIKHVQEQPQSLGKARPDLPPLVTELIDRMLAKEPERRHQNAAELLADIRRAQKATREPGGDENLDFDNSPPLRAGEESASLRRRGTGVLAALVVLAGAGSAAVGWFTRPSDPLASPATAGTASIRRLDSAREQYLHAMLLATNPDAFRAVIEQWDVAADRVWRRRAQEQLAVLCLQDRHAWDEAEKLLTTLESYGPENQRYVAEAWAGRAALRAYQHRHQESRNILQSQLGAALPDGRALGELLPESSPFRRLLSEAQMLNQQERKRSE